MVKKGKEENRLEKDWKQELARDCIALGGIFFYALVVARLFLPPVNWSYLFQFVFAAAVFLLIAAILRFKAEEHAGLGFILLVLVSLYYKNLFFAIFALIIYILLVASLFYLNVEKSKIWKGILAGAVSTIIGYFVANWVF